MNLPSPPTVSPFDQNGIPNRPWVEWTLAVWRASKPYKGHGTTAERPINGLETGDWYFDTTLGKPIWYEGPGWVDATGTAA